MRWVEAIGVVGLVALGCAAIAAALQVYYLVRRPALVPATKLLMFLALGPIPIAAAMTGNVANFEVTKERRFCGSCHVMNLFVNDAGSPRSSTLASSHSRNESFGHESCYTCHADYEMFGTVTTKFAGLRHVYYYYLGGWGNAPPEKRPKLVEPFPNGTCLHCHARERPRFRARLEHAVHAEAFERGDVGCATRDCHGPVHPDSPRPHGREKTR